MKLSEYPIYSQPMAYYKAALAIISGADNDEVKAYVASVENKQVFRPIADVRDVVYSKTYNGYVAMVPDIGRYLVDAGTNFILLMREYQKAKAQQSQSAQIAAEQSAAENAIDAAVITTAPPTVIQPGANNTVQPSMLTPQENAEVLNDSADNTNQQTVTQTAAPKATWSGLATFISLLLALK